MRKQDAEKTIYIAAAIITLVASLLYFGIQSLSLQALRGRPGLGFLQFLLPVFYAMFFAWGSLLLLSEKGDPDRTLAWLLVLFAFPVAGFLLYQILGRQVFRTRRMRRRLAQARRLSPPAQEPADTGPAALAAQGCLPAGKSAGHPAGTKAGGTGDSQASSEAEAARGPRERMSRLIKASSGFGLTLDNRVTILNNGAEIFPSMLEAMAQAKRHIHLETYIFRDDDIGSRFLRLLADKAAAGVEVRVIADGMGSCGLGRRRIRELRAQGVDFHLFAPVPFTLLHSNINFRNHRKLLILDGRTAFVGGANIGDDYLGLYPEIGFWRDVQLKIEGPAVHDLQQVFLRDWVFAAGDQALRRPEGLAAFLEGLYPAFLPAQRSGGLKRQALNAETAGELFASRAPKRPEGARKGRKEPEAFVGAKRAASGNQAARRREAALASGSDLFRRPSPAIPGLAAQITAGGPDSPWEAIMQAYHYAISTAKSSINITSPYFIPNESIATALKTAALAGLRVRLLLPKNPDHRLVYLAAMPYLEQLLKAGAEIWLYGNGFIHSKVVTVDDEIAIVGTANMDQRSFGLNFEINAILYDRRAAGSLNDDFEEDLRLAVPIKKEEFLSRPLSRRLLESFCRLLSPIL